MKISLIFPSWTFVFRKMAKVAKGASTFPPLNLAYLAAIAEKEGHQVQLIDGEVEAMNSADIVDEVRKFSPDLIGLTAATSFFHLAAEYAALLKKETSARIVVGGPHVTYFREKVFYECFDYLIIGQCDATFGKFLNELEKGNRYPDIPGIIFRRNSRIEFTGDNSQVVELDAIPYPARHLLKTELYHLGTMKGRKKYTSIMTARGCPFSCVFCNTSIYGKGVRTRSAGNVIAEIKQAMNNFGIEHFYFLDDTLTLDRQYMLNLCAEIERNKLKFSWEGSTRANLLDEELVSSLNRSGLIRISLGLETADAKIREIIKKEVSLESYVKANRLLNRYGIETINSVMLGLPGDTREAIKKTISFVRGARELKHATFGIAIPYPGTEMYDMALKGQHGLKLETQDFSKYQRYDSAVMTVNGIAPDELLRLQKRGLLSIYLVPWRIVPIIKRFGFAALIRPFLEAVFQPIKEKFKINACL